jgi:tRNA-specific 2-thiouridylase
MRLGTPDGVGDAEEECTIDPTGRPASAGLSTPPKHKQGCCSVLDAGDARRVAQLLDVPFYVLNFQEDFARVIDYFVGEYNRGRTPNPCVRCNDWLKFGRLAQYAEAIGARYVASGHYARTGVDPVTGRKTLLRGLDHKKDQSYVLFGLPDGHVEKLMLPIGEFEKTDVRRMAEELNLPVFNKPDSQEICFVPDQDYAGLVRRRSAEAFRPGELVLPDGETIGTHEGHQHFTIGQRKGLGVARGVPLYVIDIDPAADRVVLGPKERLLKRTVVAGQINLLGPRVGERPVPCYAKIRYNAQPQPAVVRRSGEDQITVTFDESQSAVAPGQAVVCYDNDVVLGGGWIDSAE